MTVPRRDERSYGMTSFEAAQVRRAIALLSSMLNKPRAGDSTRNWPVQKFAETYLARNSTAEVGCHELLQFYKEVAASGELEPLSKAEFLRRLPPAMEATFGVLKSHNIKGERGRVRGFRGVGYRQDNRPITAAEVDPPIEPEIVLPEPDLDPKPPTGPMPMTFVRTDSPRI